jgi:anti-sigma factor RsiW
MSCDRAAQVHAYHDRQLGPAAREAFELHLAECPACAALLAELRTISRLLGEAPLPTSAGAQQQINERLYAAWHLAQQRGVLRISSWLTGAAAAVLIGALLLTPKGTTSNDNTGVIAQGPPMLQQQQQQQQQANIWETTALMPPPERAGERPDEYVELAQWIATDLSTDSPGVR